MTFTGVSWWVLLVVGAVLLLVLRRFYQGFRAGWWLRSGAVVAALLILGRPAWVQDVTREVPRKVVVLVDQSDSMGLVDPGDPLSRYAHAVELLEGGLRDLLTENYTVEEIRFPAGDPPAGRNGEDGGYREPLVGERTAYRVLVPQQRELPQGWNGAGFDDASWRVASGVAGRVSGERGSVILARYGFHSEEAGQASLRLRYGDTAVVWCNGEEVFRGGHPEGVSVDGDTRSQRDRLPDEIATPQRVAIDLEEGRNTVAVHVACRGDSDPTLSLGVEIERTENRRGVAGATTDLAAALRGAGEAASRGELAGVVLLSDGRDTVDGNGRAIAGALDSLKALGSPVIAVPFGTETAPRDVAVAEVDSPDQIYLGDRLKVALRISGAQMEDDESLVVTLERDGKVLDEGVAVPGEPLTLSHVPEAAGTGRYQVRVRALEGEAFYENNLREFWTTVGDDRKHVLLVDRVPRWEFRYLRNLLFARDKSVQLQHVLFQPETLPGTEVAAPVVASADRPFGEAEAGALPRELAGWAGFDAVVLGDLQLPPTDWEHLETCVREQGMLLVLGAGREVFPGQGVPEKLLPLRWDATAGGVEEEFQFSPTLAGSRLPPFRIGDAETTDAEAWKQMPPLRWRFPVSEVKPGAEVLAYASLGDRADGLLERRFQETGRPLVVTRKYGAGRVVCLLTDETWRFRYGVGDRYHHRFWGQLIRWGTGPLLPEGNEEVRVGTGAAVHHPGEEVVLTVKLRNPVPDLKVEVAGRTLALAPDPSGRPGIYRAPLGRFDETGDYPVKIGDLLETSFSVVATQAGAEFADVTRDAERLREIADATGGAVLEPAAAGGATGFFGDPKRTVTERKETGLWDTWAVLVFILGCLITEWVLRRRRLLP